MNAPDGWNGTARPERLTDVLPIANEPDEPDVPPHLVLPAVPGPSACRDGVRRRRSRPLPSLRSADLLLHPDAST